MFEKRRMAKEAARAAEEERRMNYAADREREKVEAARAEKAGREPDALHKIGFIGERVDRFEESQGEKKIERARQREGKRIKKEKNRKYWVLLLVVLALAAGGVCGYMFDNHRMQNKYYDKGVQLILEEQYSEAGAVLGELTTKDAEKLYAYSAIRADVHAYDGKTNKMLKELKELDPFDSSKIESQYKDFVAEYEPVGTLQRDINKLDVTSLKLSDKDKVADLRARADKLKDKYAKMLDTSKLKEAEKKMEVLQEATDKLQNYNKKDSSQKE